MERNVEISGKTKREAGEEISIESDEERTIEIKEEISIESDKRVIQTDCRRKMIHKKGRHTAGRDNNKSSAGRYYCDYSPRYEETYDIYEKAKRHVKQVRNEERMNNRRK